MLQWAGCRLSPLSSPSSLFFLGLVFFYLSKRCAMHCFHWMQIILPSSAIPSMCVWGRKRERESVYVRSRTLFMKQGLSLKLSPIRENWLASESQEFFCPCLSSVGMTCMHQHTYLFCVGSGRSSSVPQASRAGTLQSEPSLQHGFFFLDPNFLLF